VIRPVRLWPCASSFFAIHFRQQLCETPLHRAVGDPPDRGRWCTNRFPRIGAPSQTTPLSRTFPPVFQSSGYVSTSIEIKARSISGTRRVSSIIAPRGIPTSENAPCPGPRYDNVVSSSRGSNGATGGGRTPADIRMNQIENNGPVPAASLQAFPCMYFRHCGLR